MGAKLILIQFSRADDNAKRAGADAVILNDLHPGQWNAESPKKMNEKDQQHLIGEAGTDPEDDRFASLQSIKIVKQLAWPPQIVWPHFNALMRQQIGPPQLAGPAPVG